MLITRHLCTRLNIIITWLLMSESTITQYKSAVNWQALALNVLFRHRIIIIIIIIIIIDGLTGHVVRCLISDRKLPTRVRSSALPLWRSGYTGTWEELVNYLTEKELIWLRKYNATHIVLLCCHQLVLLDRCVALGSCKPKIYFLV